MLEDDDQELVLATSVVSMSFPRMLSSISIASIVLGILGAISAFSTVATLAISRLLDGVGTRLSELSANPDLAEQLGAQADINRQWAVFNIPIALALLVACVFLVWGAVRVLRRTTATGGMLRRTLAALWVLEAVRFPVVLLVVFASTRMAMQSYPYARGAGESAATPDWFAGMYVWMSVATSSVWFLMKFIAYGYAWLYLRRPATRAYLAKAHLLARPTA